MMTGFFRMLTTFLLVFIVWLLVSQRQGGWSSLFSRQKLIILDSCALIDGRIIEIVKSGFISTQLIIPQFVLNELQLLADGSDSHKRERARFGMDIARELQELSPKNVIINRDNIPGKTATDDKLIELCKKKSAQLYTTDYNLAKVASIEGVQVLNVNELAQNLRPVTLPGETLDIKIIQKGTNREQGVGYLDDGTMIVVDGAAKYVGHVVPVTVSRMHQTVAGKMVFGQIKESTKPRTVESHETKVEPKEVARRELPRFKKLANPLAAKARLLRPSRVRMPTYNKQDL